MKHLSAQRKESTIVKMMPPSNVPITQLSIEVGIAEQVLLLGEKAGNKVSGPATPPIFVTQSQA